jgi:hypothetical protein
MLSWEWLSRRLAWRDHAQLNIFSRSTLCEHYRRTCRAHEEALWESYQPLLEELNRSVPVHQAA